MSELKAFDVIINDDYKTKCYMKADADKVIAELKDKLKVQTSNAEEAWKLKDSYHTGYAEAVKELYDKNKEIAELKRTLWLARAISAINAVGEIHNVIVCMRERNPKMSLSNTEAQEQVWKNVARKCRAKAEEYK